jgi:hypothetical protein
MQYTISYIADICKFNFISKLGQTFFSLVQARTIELEAKKTGKHHKCQSNMFFLTKS